MADEKAKVPPSPESDTAKESGKQSLADMVKAVKAAQEKQTDFPSVVVFGKQAENCERHLGKGRLVGIQGRIQTGKYQNRDGVTVRTTEVVANNVEFLDWGDSGKQKQRTQEPDVPDGFAAVEDDESIPF